MAFFEFLKGEDKAKDEGIPRAAAPPAVDQPPASELVTVALSNPVEPTALPRPDDRAAPALEASSVADTQRTPSRPSPPSISPLPNAQLPSPPQPPSGAASRDQAPTAVPSTANEEATEYVPTASNSGELIGVLVAINGDLKGQLFGLADGENRLGRGAGSSIQLDSKKISRPHALLTHKGSRFVIEPLNERNPTFLNDVRTQGAELRDGDTIRLGDTTFKFRTI